MAENKNDVWLREAAAVARQFVMMFNSSMLYGCAHPSVAKGAVAFCDLLNASFRGREMITVILHNGNLMIEDWPLDRSFNTAKLVGHFGKLGITSISFEPGVTADDIIHLVGIAGDAHNVDICKVALADAVAGGLPNIRVNYVLFGKIRADEVVVKEADAARAAGGSGPQGGVPTTAELINAISAVNTASAVNATNVTAGNLSRESVAQIEEVLTLSSLLERPKEISAVLAQTDTSKFPVEELHNAFGKIKSEIDGAPGVGIDTLLQSLYGLKKDLYEAIEVQKTTGRMMRSAAVINKELNDLTNLAIVKLIKEEYKSGKTPLNRLAHTIRRMLPGNAELMHILPQLKATLLADGMTLGDYLELVQMLGLKVESEALSDSLKEAAEAMGASVTDLVAAIQSKPEEAARLIFLASEIRQGTGESESNLSNVLTGYIEDVCSKMAVETCGADSRQNSASLKKVLAQLESQMFNQLTQETDIPPQVMMDVRQRLTERFKDAYSAANDTFTENRKKQVGSAAAATGAGAPKGAARSKVKMPSESLNANNLFFLINKEIKRNLRYKSPFATITVSIEKIIQQDGVRPPKPEDHVELLPQLFVHVEALLRDVDLIGTIGNEANPELFILLPMTGEEGTGIVKERIVKKAAESAFAAAGRKVGVVAKVSSAAPNENTRDLKTYMALVQANHRREK